MEGPLCRACLVRHQGLDEIPQLRQLDNFVPHYQEVVIAEVECTFHGVSMGEGCCCQGQALARTVQLDRAVGCISFGPQWSVFWVKKHLVTGADSL